MLNKEICDDEDVLLPWLEPKKEPVKPEKRTAFSRHREGFLQRKGDWTGFWRKRYFRLSKGVLVSYLCLTLMHKFLGLFSIGDRRETRHVNTGNPNIGHYRRG